MVRAQSTSQWYSGTSVMSGSSEDRNGIEYKNGGRVEMQSNSTSKYPMNQWVSMTTAVAGNDVKVAIDGDHYTATLSHVNGAGGVLVGVTQLDARMDDLVVRKYANPEPETIVGSEETN